MSGFWATIAKLLRSPTRRPIPVGVFYYGHRITGIYHRDDCPKARMMRRGFRLLRSQLQAVDEEYRPCMVCMPDKNPYKPDEWVPDFWAMHKPE